MALLLLRHFAGDLFHEFGAKIGQHAVDDAGDIVLITFRLSGRGLLQNLLRTGGYGTSGSLGWCRLGRVEFSGLGFSRLIAFASIAGLTPARPGGCRVLDR